MNKYNTLSYGIVIIKTGRKTFKTTRKKRIYVTLLFNRKSSFFYLKLILSCHIPYGGVYIIKISIYFRITNFKMIVFILSSLILTKFVVIKKVVRQIIEKIL